MLFLFACFNFGDSFWSFRAGSRGFRGAEALMRTPKTFSKWV